MYIGHFAPAFAAAAASPDAPRLGKLFVAAQLVDLVFFAFALVGLEHMRVVPGITTMNPMDLYHMPYTHSLLGTALWAAGFGIIVWRLSRSAAAGGLAALVVAAHWLLDLLVHRPDLTIAGHPPKLGLGLWNWPLAEIPLELGLTLGAFTFYLSRTRGPAGPPIVLMAVLLLFQAVNWFGTQPEAYSVAMPLTALFSYAVMTGLARWAGATRRHRHAMAIVSLRR